MMMKADFGGLAVGDVAPGLGARAGLFTPGASRWYALRVAPQREDQVEAWLDQRGVLGFHPVQRRINRVRGITREYHRRYLPGYVFARFPGDPLVHQVMLCPWIAGALCRSDGSWGILEPKKLRAIYTMRKLDAAQRDARAEERIRRQQAAALRVGDTAMFRGGLLGELSGEVVELTAEGGATIRLTMFGREHLVPAVAADLVPLRKAG